MTTSCIEFTPWTSGAQSVPEAETLILPIGQGCFLSPAMTALDKALDGVVQHLLEDSPRFSGKPGDHLDIRGMAGQKTPPSRVILAGAGPLDGKNGPERHCGQSLGGQIAGIMAGLGVKKACLVLDDTIFTAEQAADIACGLCLRQYHFTRYKPHMPPREEFRIEEFRLAVADADKGRRIFQDAKQAIVHGVYTARDLVSEPPNILSPVEFASRLEAMGQESGLVVNILDEAQMKAQGMHALLAVGRGSVQESRCVTLLWKGLPDDKTVHAGIVGKGVTFDTGGISLKPSAGMHDMKWDMSGAGAVAGLMALLAERQAKANIVGIVALTENMPGGNAQRPGDIITAMNGHTIEVLNTDAEGRLILADALTYVQKHFSPERIIDLATLTGAIIVSLGNAYAGLFTNDETLKTQLVASGESTGERLWPMPLGRAYDRQLKSDVADMKNIGGRDAGAITAAQFLKRFIENDTPWAHLDIAGVAWATENKPLHRKGATGFGVRLLDQFIRTAIEQTKKT